MMQPAVLDSREHIATLDRSNVLGSIEALADQVRQAYEETRALTFTAKGEIRNVVVAGMGGSALGADVIKTLFKEKLNVPFDFVRDYTLPGYVSSSTLVVLSSYSGTTEEVLSCAQAAEQAGAQIMVIAAGGTLGKLAQEKGYTAYLLNPTHNPSNQPRMAIGYAVFGMIGLLATAGVLELTQAEVDEVVTTIIAQIEENKVEVSQNENLTKTLAFTAIERRPIFIAAEFLEGAVHVGTNQINENAKLFADYKLIPEINHHLLEGLRFPSTNPDTHVFIFITSELYRPQNQLRMKISQQMVEDMGFETTVIALESETKLTQVFELITQLAFTGLYLSTLEAIDPAPIPTVDRLKGELAAHRS